MPERSRLTPEYYNKTGAGFLPNYLGVVVTEIGAGEVKAHIVITGHHLASLSGFLHAGSIITLADAACGVGCFAHLPEGAGSFTTVELKSNFLSNAREGTLECSRTCDSSRQKHPGVGCDCSSQGKRQDDSTFSMHSIHYVSEILNLPNEASRSRPSRVIDLSCGRPPLYALTHRAGRPARTLHKVKQCEARGA